MSKPARNHDLFFAALPAQARETFSYCGERILLEPPADTLVIKGSDLLDANRFEEILAPFAAAYPQADRRVIVSMWSLYYFSALFIPAVVFALLLRTRPPLALEDIRIAFEREKRIPKHFIVSLPPRQSPGAGIHGLMQPVLRDHACVLIEFLRMNAGLSSRVLWSNAASYLSWAIEEVGRHMDERLEEEGRKLLGDERLPDGTGNPLHGLLSRVEAQGMVVSRRRLCCLRYLLPGVASCGLLCPVPHRAN